MEPIKVVVRYSDGRVLKGYTQNFAPDKAYFHIRPVNMEAQNQIIKVSIKDLKGVFFVRDFAGDPDYKEKKTFPYGMNIIGRKIEVTFKDGEVMVGSTTGYDPHLRRPGFFVSPSDPDWNLLRVFVVSEAVAWVCYL